MIKLVVADASACGSSGPCYDSGNASKWTKRLLKITGGVASHADVLRLVTRAACGEERVTSLRTSAWEASGGAAYSLPV